MLAQYAETFREVDEGAFNCRLLWTTGGSSTADQIEAKTCWLQARTANIDATLVLQGWGKLAIPDSMKSLVRDTLEPLLSLNALNFDTDCGTGDLPEDLGDCDVALGQQRAALTGLRSQLSAWKPYGV